MSDQLGKQSMRMLGKRAARFDAGPVRPRPGRGPRLHPGLDAADRRTAGPGHRPLPGLGGRASADGGQRRSVAVVAGAGGDEIAMGEAAPFGRLAQNVRAAGMIGVQRVVKPRDHSGGVTECRMVGDVADAFAVDPDFASVIEAVEEFLAGVGQNRFGCFRHGDEVSLYVVF